MRRIAGLMAVVWVIAGGAMARANNSPRTEVSINVGLPERDAFGRYWRAGLGCGVQRLLAEPRGLYPTLGGRYNYYFFRGQYEDGFGTHGLRASMAACWRPGFATACEVSAGCGVGGMWTGKSRPSGIEIIEAAKRDSGSPIGYGGRRVGQIHGWGPTVELGGGIAFQDEFGTRSTLRALWIRTWASDIFLDQMLLELALAF